MFEYVLKVGLKRFSLIWRGRSVLSRQKGLAFVGLVFGAMFEGGVFIDMAERECFIEAKGTARQLAPRVPTVNTGKE